jgi:hypothetical protein
MKLLKTILIGFVPKNIFSDLSEPKHDHKGSSKTYVDEIQCLIDKTSAVDLNASSLDIT